VRCSPLHPMSGFGCAQGRPCPTPVRVWCCGSRVPPAQRQLLHLDAGQLPVLPARPPRQFISVDELGDVPHADTEYGRSLLPRHLIARVRHA
jgi:hypothetical protein